MFDPFDPPRGVLAQLKLGRMRGPAAAIAVPAVVGLISAYMAKKSADKQADTMRSALTPSGQENLARTGSLTSAGSLANAAPGLLSLGTNALSRGVGYNTALLGSRTAQQAATAAPAAQIVDQYAGAARGLTPGDRSGTGSLVRAELERDKAGKIARLTSGVQAGAADRLMAAGGETTGQGLGALGTAGSLYTNLGTGLASARLGTAGQLSGVLGTQSASNQQTGSNIMGILQSVMGAKGGKPGGAGAAGGALNFGNIGSPSDRRLKKNIRRVGTHQLGIGLYAFDYIWGEPSVGVMADEVEKVMPEAVTRVAGYKFVRYGMLG